jgi:hypothetical protein
MVILWCGCVDLSTKNSLTVIDYQGNDRCEAVELRGGGRCDQLCLSTVYVVDQGLYP